ncbi:MAG: hypothetical protein ACFFDN_37865, partial [Candidatus Hodarchaeota archaeon]
AKLKNNQIVMLVEKISIQIQKELKEPTQNIDFVVLIMIARGYAILNTYPVELMELLFSSIRTNMQKLEPRSLADMAWVCEKFKRHNLDKEFIKEVFIQSQEKITEFNAQDVATITWAYAELDFVLNFDCDKNFLNNITIQIKNKIMEFTNQGLVMIVSAYVKLRIDDKGLKNDILSRIKEKQTPLSVPGLVMISKVVADIEPFERDKELIEKMHVQVQYQQKKFFLEGPQGVVRLLQVCARLEINDEDLIDRIFSEINKLIIRFTVQELVDILWSCAKLERQDQQLINQICSKIVEEGIIGWEIRNLVKVVQACAELTKKNDIFQIENKELFTKVFFQIEKQMEKLNHLELNALVRACSVLKVQDVREKIFLQISQKIAQFSTREFIALAREWLQQSEFTDLGFIIDEMNKQLSEKAQDFSAHDLVVLIRVCAECLKEKTKAKKHHIIFSQIEKKIGEFTLLDLIVLIERFVTMPKQDPIVIQKIFERINNEMMAQLQLDYLVTLAISFVKLKVQANRVFVRNIYTRISNEVNSFSPQQLVNILWTCGKLTKVGRKLDGNEVDAILKKIFEYLSLEDVMFEARDLVNIIKALARLVSKNQDLMKIKMEPLLCKIQDCLDEFTPRHLSEIMESCAILGIGNGEFIAKMSTQIQKMEFEPLQLTMIACACVKLPVRDQKLMDMVIGQSKEKIAKFSSLNLSKLKEACTQLGMLISQLLSN